MPTRLEVNNIIGTKLTPSGGGDKIVSQELRDTLGSILDYTDQALADKSALNHTHGIGQVTGLGTAATKNAPATGNASVSEVVLGNDSRLSDARTPLGHSHTKSQITDFAHNHPVGEITGLGTAATRNIASSGNASVTELVLGNDSRLNDARTPLAHNHTASNISDFSSATDSRISLSLLTGHSDVQMSALTNGQLVQWNGTKFVNWTPSFGQSVITNLTSDLAGKAPIASPVLTGIPTAPTAALNTNTTQIATTAFVKQQIDATDIYFDEITLVGTGTSELTAIKVETTALANFTSTTKGVVPASGGGTTNFLRADGIWAQPTSGGSGSGTPGGSNGQIQFNNNGSFGGMVHTYNPTTKTLDFSSTALNEIPLYFTHVAPTTQDNAYLFRVYINGEDYERYSVQSDGTHAWNDGTKTLEDVYLYRSSTSKLTISSDKATGIANLQVTGLKANTGQTNLIAASDDGTLISVSTIGVDKLSATGVRDATTVLYGDGTWKAAPTGGSGSVPAIAENTFVIGNGTGIQGFSGLKVTANGNITFNTKLPNKHTNQQGYRGIWMDTNTYSALMGVPDQGIQLSANIVMGDGNGPDTGNGGYWKLQLPEKPGWSVGLNYEGDNFYVRRHRDPINWYALDFDDLFRVDGISKLVTILGGAVALTTQYTYTNQSSPGTSSRENKSFWFDDNFLYYKTSTGIVKTIALAALPD